MAELKLTGLGLRLYGNQVFDTDSAYDIGAAGATRPRDLFLGRHAVIASDLTVGGKAFIGDSVNTNVTVGITVNQQGNDDQIFALKSSDVDHGMTAVAEADTFAFAQKVAGAAGGLALVGLTETTVALQLLGFATTDNTTKSTAGSAHILVDARTKSGTGSAATGADANLFGVTNAGTLRFIVDAEGTPHSDEVAATF